MADKSSIPIIRPMIRKDLDRIVEIDIKVLGKARPEYWEMKLVVMEKRAPVSSLVAELDGTVVGFIIGESSGWPYGIPGSEGWIDTIGVDPEYQSKGIAKILFTEMVNNLKRAGVNKIYTFVSWQDWNLLKFLNHMGFQKGNMINLELKV